MRPGPALSSLAAFARQCRGLRLRQPEAWPAAHRRLFLVLAGAAGLLTGWTSFCDARLDELAREQGTHASLRAAFAEKAGRDTDPDALAQRCSAVARRVALAEGLLPDRAGVDELLADINRAGIASGLRFEWFRPQADEAGPHFAVVPVALRAVGRYRELVAFHAAVAALPRIVGMRNLQLSARKGDASLTMDVVAMAYRALDASERAAQMRPPARSQAAPVAGRGQ